MRHIVLVFPHQLFKHHPAIHAGGVLVSTEVYLLEEFLMFKKYNFHAQKLVLHRASMKSYEQVLLKDGFVTHYIEHTDLPDTESVCKVLSKNGVKHVHIADVVDDWLEMQIIKCLKKYEIKVTWYETPMFLNTKSECIEWAATHPKLLMHHFYVSQRKKFNILIEDTNKIAKPIGGMWSFDSENRKKIPKGMKIPHIDFETLSDEGTVVCEAIVYIQTHFPNAYGDPRMFRYAVTHAGAKRALDEFIKERLEYFGPYEDAIQKDESFLFHSVLTPYLNNGTLTPQQVVDAVLMTEDCIPLASREGFMRQIIGWREFMRLVYISHGRFMRTKNFWNHTKKLPKTYWKGETGIEPVDSTIKKVLRTAYSHHIERLMVIGNYMLLSEYHPDDVHTWFMEMYIDSYDWVMVPNVYGMSQYADGGVFATKPYVSASNYILKMSNYKKGDWSAEWDRKFWNFLMKHEVFFSKNPRMNMLLQSRKKKMNL